MNEQGSRVEHRGWLANIRALWGIVVPQPKVVLWLTRMSPDDLRAQIEQEPEFAKARKFKLTIEPKQDVSYEWLWDYASDKFKRAQQTYKDLDDKAGDIIKYLGGGTGIFALATLANMTTANYCVIISATPSFVFALISIFLAASTRRPVRLPNHQRSGSHIDTQSDTKKKRNPRLRSLGNGILPAKACFGPTKLRDCESTLQRSITRGLLPSWYFR